MNRTDAEQYRGEILEQCRLRAWYLRSDLNEAKRYQHHHSHRMRHIRRVVNTRLLESHAEVIVSDPLFYMPASTDGSPASSTVAPSPPPPPPKHKQRERRTSYGHDRDHRSGREQESYRQTEPQPTQHGEPRDTSRRRAAASPQRAYNHDPLQRPHETTRPVHHRELYMAEKRRTDSQSYDGPAMMTPAVVHVEPLQQEHRGRTKSRNRSHQQGRDNSWYSSQRPVEPPHSRQPSRQRSDYDSGYGSMPPTPPTEHSRVAKPHDRSERQRSRSSSHDSRQDHDPSRRRGRSDSATSSHHSSQPIPREQPQSQQYAERRDTSSEPGQREPRHPHRPSRHGRDSSRSSRSSRESRTQSRQRHAHASARHDSPPAVSRGHYPPNSAESRRWQMGSQGPERSGRRRRSSETRRSSSSSRGNFYYG